MQTLFSSSGCPSLLIQFYSTTSGYKFGEMMTQPAPKIKKGIKYHVHQWEGLPRNLQLKRVKTTLALSIIQIRSLDVRGAGIGADIQHCYQRSRLLPDLFSAIPVLANESQHGGEAAATGWGTIAFEAEKKKPGWLGGQGDDGVGGP